VAIEDGEFLIIAWSDRQFRQRTSEDYFIVYSKKRNKFKIRLWIRSSENNKSNWICKMRKIKNYIGRTSL